MASLDAMTVWIHYSRKLGDARIRTAHSRPLQPGEEWSDEPSVTHAVQYGRTMCGVDVLNKSLRYGWTEDVYARRCDALHVSCRRCRHVLEKETV